MLIYPPDNIEIVKIYRVTLFKIMVSRPDRMGP